MNFAMRLAAGLCSVVLLIGLAGCSGGVKQAATGKVSGKVTSEGKPVEAGSVTFVPVTEGASADTGVASKPGGGSINSDGSYVLTTYVAGDGAIVGRHRVTFFPPASQASETAAGEPGKHDETPAPSPYRGLMPKEAEVEVKAGTNEINIELVPNPDVK
ncbi:MAG: hypothetical protein GX575_25140 [Candidatus Anammoximicrobium sp.]|nr:hypothetical protein [Candidatus Anammoximicrobium sp.]